MNETETIENHIEAEGRIEVVDVAMLIYVAGPLNDNAVGYIKNLHQMLKFGNMVRWKGHSPFIPGMDFLLGLLDGQMVYQDYFGMSQPWLEILAEVKSRPTALWYTSPSPGADKELETADRLKIRVIRDYAEIPYTRVAYLETCKLTNQSASESLVEQNMDAKICSKCKQTKPMDSFYRRRDARDGRHNYCSECMKADVLKYRSDNLEKIRACDRERGKLPHRAAARAKYRKTLKGRTAMARGRQKYDRQHPLQKAVNIILNNAINLGKIKKSETCLECGAMGIIHGHHNDYSKPLEVEWLCPFCHARRGRIAQTQRLLAEVANTEG